MTPKATLFFLAAGLVASGATVRAQAADTTKDVPVAAASSTARAQSSQRSQRATNVIGAQVYDRTGHERIGQIEELVIDRDGKVSLAILTLRPDASRTAATSAAKATTNTGSDVASGTARSRDPGAVTVPPGSLRSPGTPSTGLSASVAAAAANDRLYAVPWKLLSYDEPLQHFVLDVAADKLASAPVFTRTGWPDISDPGWNQRVYRHFGERYEVAAAEQKPGPRR